MIKKKTKKKNKKSLDQPLQIIIKPEQSPALLSYQEACVTAQQLQQRGDIDAAIAIHKQLITALPKQAHSYSALLELYQSNHTLAPAKALLNKLKGKFTNNPKVLSAMASTYFALGDIEAASKLINLALVYQPESAVLIARKAQFYLASGDADAALDCYQQSLTLDASPANISAYQGLARLQKGRMATEIKEQIKSCINSGQYQGFQLANLHFSLAWGIGTDDPDYFQHLQNGNRIINEAHPWAWQNSYLQMQQIRSYISPTLVSESQNMGIPSIAPVLIAGMPRSGTTLMEQIIGAHHHTYPVGESNIVANTIKQLARITNHSSEHWNWQGGEAFASYVEIIDQHFRSNEHYQAAGNKRLVDKSIDNYEYLGMLLLTYPATRVIHMQRHPMDIVFSCYQQLFESGFNLLFDIERIARVLVMQEQQMAHWKKRFPDNILTVNYETLVNQQEQQTRDILAFCQLDWDPNCLQFNQQKTLVKTSSDTQVREKLHTGAIGKWKAFSSQLKPADDILKNNLPDLMTSYHSQG